MATLRLPTSGTISGLENNLDANAALGALATMLQGDSAPTTASTGLTTLAGVWWHDTANRVVKVRSQADDKWIPVLRVNEAAGTVPAFGSSIGTPRFIQKTADYTPSFPDDDGQWFSAHATGVTFHLPAPSSCIGAHVAFTGEAACTLAVATGGILIGGATLSSISLGAGEFVAVQANASNWAVFTATPRVQGAVMSVGGATGDVTADQIKSAIGLASYALTSALSAYATIASLTAYAPKASPVLTGNPTAPTQTGGDSSTKLATTAFVASALAALLVSPAFTGSPTAPTPANSDDSTRVATTAWVRANFSLIPPDSGGGPGGG